jgi:phage shock protein C
MTTYKQLFRSNKNRVFGGVCGGIGKFINVDPVIIRLIWLGFTFAFGIGIIIYFLSWLVIPKEPIIFNEVKKEEKTEPETEPEVEETK